ncbi:acyltransferase family protein [Cupriavidus plantarum]|uniref:acyltransferase family protein n=1 Tax=Cupriavidus plantarum TaxID=942865 RepID=UPI0011C035C1|nr:acyltransferase [Cupriavidus plantarum]
MKLRDMAPPATLKTPLGTIQALRGIAALLVVASHGAFVLGPLDSHPFLRNFLESGAIGVDLFFMISGFIMIYSTWGAGSGRDVLDFLIKRFCRIWPAYLAWTLAWLMIRDGGISGGPAVDIVKSIFFLPLSIISPPFYGYAALNVGWTLNYEIQFYLLFAASMLFGRARWWMLAGAFAVLLVLVPMVNGVAPALNPYRAAIFGSALADMATNPIILEFGFGVVVGWLYLRAPLTLPWRLSAIVMAIFSVVVVWQLSHHVGFGHGFTGWGITLAPLFVAAALFEKALRPRIARWLLWLGEISFSLYLSHKIVFFLCARFAPRFEMLRALPGGVLLAIYVTIALVVASLSTSLLEKRVSERLRAWALNRGPHSGLSRGVGSAR